MIKAKLRQPYQKLSHGLNPTYPVCFLFQLMLLHNNNYHYHDHRTQIVNVNSVLSELIEAILSGLKVNFDAALF